jgi:hypothetical protein
VLFGAGTKTTTHLISGAVVERLRESELCDWLAEDWKRLNWECFVSLVQFTKPRFVHEDIELGACAS